jgi:hypothetical protein
VIIWQKIGDGDIVTATSDVSFFTKQIKATHRDQDGIHVDAPQIKEKDHLWAE